MKIMTASLALGILLGLAGCDNGSGASAGADSAKIAGDSSLMPKDSAKTAVAATPKKKKLKASLGEFGKSTGKVYKKDKDGVYDNAEVMPSFRGGADAIGNYVNNNLNPGDQAISDAKEGTIRVMFVVDEKGKVQNAHAMGPQLGDGLDEEAVRVVSNMPDWEPGKINGKPVKVSLTLPIVFKPEM